MATKKTGAKKPLVMKDVAKALARSGGAGIDAGGLLASLIQCWGGRERFAKDIFGEYQVAKPGSLTRQKILEMISRLTVQVTTQEINKPRGASEMTDEDLFLAAGSLLARLNTDGQPTPAPEKKGPTPQGPGPDDE